MKTIKRSLKRIFLILFIVVLLFELWSEVTLIKNTQLLKGAFPESFEGRNASWVPAIVYYLRPLFGLSNQKFFSAGLKLEFETKSQIGYGAGVFGPVVWRYYNNVEIDSLNRLP
jgi:hypothetical protein